MILEAFKINRYPASTLFDEMNKCHETGKHRKAVIVYAESNWDQPYSLESRSYISDSNQWGWDYSKAGHCRIGSSLDGSDVGIRLDWYDWKIEYWYWADDSK